VVGLVHHGLDAEEVIQVVGFFQPVPAGVMKGRVSIKDVKPPCPVTYVVLTLDRLLPIQLQRRMALRLGEVEIEDLGACHAAMLHRPKEVAQILLRYA
jgi:pimeloyl-ACP methyl ester carboxylesterase